MLFIVGESDRASKRGRTSKKPLDSWCYRHNIRNMNTLNELVSEAITEFEKVATLANAEFPVDSMTVEIAVKPHRAPTGLPADKIAVYAFFLNGQALKVGKVGPKSAARYTSQHYNPASAGSTLAGSILANAARVGAFGVDTGSVGDWIRTHTDRVNLLLPKSFGGAMLSLLESFLHVRWKPVFEGRVETD
jgi:hypothetical protein